MADLLKNVLEYLKVNKKVTKDNVAFRIVTVGSFGIFMLCSILNGLTSYVSNPITCDGSSNTPLMEVNCWLHGSYNLGQVYNETKNCFRENEEPNWSTWNKGEVTTLYYQWVVFALVLSAILLRLPAWIWSMLEGGLMTNFYNSNKSLDVLREKEDDVKYLVEKEAKVFKRLQGRWTTKTYYLKFFACQCLALLVLYLTFHGTDQFLDGKFKTYGKDVVMYYNIDGSERQNFFNPMCSAFPTKVACVLNKTGTGGQVTSLNELCILSQNIINEKIYIILWFWFAAMFAIMTAQLIWEVCFLTLPLVDRILKLALPSSSGISKYFRQFLIGQVTTGTASLTRNMVAYLQTLSFGDIFVLYQLGKNAHPDFFYEMLIKLSANEHETETDETQPMLLGENGGVEMNSVVTSN